jgi:hypothetical protein
MAQSLMSHKACVDCKHAVVLDWSQIECMHPKTGTPNLVHGGFKYSPASMMRHSYRCGPDGKLWEPKEVPVPVSFFRRLWRKQ